MSEEGSRWWKEPLLHFVVIGAAIFGVERSRAEPKEPSIHLSDSFLQALEIEEEQRSGRRPRTPVERGAMVARFLRDEALFREAERLGLARGDTIVRRRLIQKMEFLLRGSVDVGEASEADLEALLREDEARVRRPARVAVTHVVFSAPRREEAAALLPSLSEVERAPERGDPFLQGFDQPLRTQADIAGRFGDAFAASVLNAPLGEWSGPVESSFGVHLVRITELEDARTPRVEEAEDALRRAWRQREEDRAFERAVEAVVARYPIERDE
ncbi:MAG: peptidylprolyl isomerase [Myxococcota bacterium]